MEELKKLYDVLVREGKYSKSFEEFQSKWSNDQTYKDKVYGVVTRDGLYSKDKDAFLQKYSGSATPLIKKKDSSESVEPQEPQAATMVSPSEDGSSGTPPTKLIPDYERKDLNAFEKTAYYLNGLQSEFAKSVLSFVKDAAEASSKSLKGHGFGEEEDKTLNKTKYDSKGNVIYRVDPTFLHPEKKQGAISEVINSALPDNIKKSIISGFNQLSSTMEDRIKGIEEYQGYTLPKDNIPTEVAKGISGMVPDLIVAAALKNPAIAEERIASLSAKVSQKALPILEKYAPKAVKVVEKVIPKTVKFGLEGSASGFTKVLGVKGGIKAMADTEEGENIYTNAIIGSAKGALEGVYMHGLGEVAGKVVNPIARGISKAGINSAISTTIATPLANAGVFATARALRTPIEEGRMATAEELAMEAGTGVGFSLLHLGSQYKNQKEANYYYDTVLQNDVSGSFGRVLNETKDNLDIAYNPELKPETVKELEEARDEIKKAILKEPDLKTKKILGNEAINIQNQLDAHATIDNIVNNKDAVIDLINRNEKLDNEQKDFYTKKIEAIADHFDNSEYGLKKKDLDSRIKQTEKELAVSGETFTNLTKASDRKLAKIKIEEQRKKLEDLNKELDDLVTNKYNEDAIQKQTTDESVLRTEQPELGLQGMGEGNAQEQTIINEKPEEEVIGTPVKDAIGDIDGIYYYNGEKGNLVQFGDMVSFESDNKIIDLIDINEINGQTVEDFGVNHEKELNFKLNEDNSIELNDKKYVNNYSDPESAFSRDKDGNYTVTLETENGQKRTFRGQQADRIVYETRLKNFEQNGTEQQIEDAHAAADEAIRIETEARESAPKREGKSVRKGKQRTLKTVKEPLTKAERAQQETATLEDKIKLQDLYASEEYSSKVKAVTKGEPMGSFFDDYTKAKKDGSNPELVKAVDDLLAIEYKAPKGAEGMLPVGTEVEYNGKKGKIMEVSNFVGNQEYRIAFDSKNKTSYEFINVKDFNKNGKAIETPKVEATPVEAKAEAKAEPKSEAKTELTIDEQMAQYIDEANSYQDEMSAVEKDNSFTEEQKNNKLDELEKKYIQALRKSNALAFEKAGSKPYQVNDLLNVNTKEEGGLKKVYDYLDKLDKSLDLDPNELNDVTRVMAVSTAKAVIKTLKALVNAGMTLQKAIQMASEAHKVKEEQIIDALDIVSKINENKSEGISEMELPGYNKLSKVIDSAIANGKTIDNILNYMNRSEVYKNATDVQKELLVRDVRKRFGLREKSAPSVGKLFGTIKDIAKITMTEKAGLIKQIKDTAKGARESIQIWKQKTQELTKDLAELKKSGKITVSQETAILNKFGKVNIFSEKSVARFTDYMTKVFADADYKQKLTNARKNLSSIKDLSKNEKKNGDLRALGSEFAKIDPSIVENIDEYNNISYKIKEALEGSKIRKSNVKFAETVNIENATEYIEKTLKEQVVKLREEKINELQDLLDVDASKFSAEEIDNLLNIYGEEKSADTIKYNEGIIRAAVKKAFNIYSTVIKEMVSTGEDPFTGEQVYFDKKQKDLIESFMKIDPNKIADPKDALSIVDSLINFVQNKSTAGMLRPIADFEAIIGGNELVKEGLESKGLRKFWSPNFGKLLGEQTTTLPVLFEKLFKGFNRASKVEDKIGLTDLINSKSFGQNEGNAIINDYVREFFKKKANGEEYNSSYNDIERGVLAHVMRNIIGTEAEMKKEFDTRKQEVKDGADYIIKDGNKEEKEVGELVKKAYNKILSDSKTIQDVKSKADNVNLEGVEHWIKQWEKKYEPLSDLALNFYNTALGKGVNYTPDRVIRSQGNTEEVDLENNESAFINNTDGVLYNKKTGSLIEKSKDRKVPKDMYIDFSFDKKNANSMYDALIDLNTAFHIRKVQSFLNSDNFKKVFKEDGDLIKKRIKGFVRNSRNKNPYSGSELTGMIKKLDQVATIGVTQALASPIQPFKQTIPVAVSTAINAGSLGMGAAFNPGYNAWLSKLGYAISNRGIESQAEVESINKLLEKASNSKKEEAIKIIKKANDVMLKSTLVKPDVWIARASFKAYYEQSLKKQGEKSSNIDYNSHEVNKEAANYAQRMVDRQQNISDHDLAGDLFTDKNSVTKATVKMLMAFSSFRMNQGSRLGADLSTLEYWNTSTKQDKVIALRSIAGYAAEQAAFRGLQIGYSMLLYYAAKKLMNRPEDEDEDKKFKNNLIKASTTGTITDTFSPIPLLDPYVQNLSAISVDEIQDLVNIPEKDKIKLFEANKQEAIKSLGVYGIVPEKAGQLWDLTKLAYSKKYTDDYGKQKEISQKDADALKVLIGPFLASSASGIASPDVSSVVRKSIKMAKKGGKSNTVLRTVKAGDEFK